MLHQPFEPVFVVDVSAVWDRRLQVATVYASQIGDQPDEPVTALSGGRFLDVLAARATFYGAMIGAERGEPFNCRGPLAVRRPAGARAARPDRTRVPLDDLGARHDAALDSGVDSACCRLVWSR